MIAGSRPGHSTGEFDLNELLQRTVAVDGTFLHAVSEVAWAVANSNNHGATRHRARFDAQINVATWLPEAIVVPDRGESEPDSAVNHILTGRLYLYDRGYSGFSLIDAHYEPNSESPTTLQAKAYFVIRYKKEGGNSTSLADPFDRALSEEDRAAGVSSGRVGYFASANARQAGISKIPLREVMIPYEENDEQKIVRLINSCNGSRSDKFSLQDWWCKSASANPLSWWSNWACGTRPEILLAVSPSRGATPPGILVTPVMRSCSWGCFASSTRAHGSWKPIYWNHGCRLR